MGTYALDKAAEVFQKRKRQASIAMAAMVRDAATHFHQAVVEATPVDTGAARSNWVVTLNNAFDAFIPAYAPGKNLGISEGGNAGAAISQGEAAIKDYQGLAGEAIYVSNNAPYIGYLNDPSTTNKPSHQSHPFFVQLAIQAAVLHATANTRFIFPEGV